MEKALFRKPMIKEEITRDMRKYAELNNIETQNTKTYEMKLTQCLVGNL